MEKSEEEIYYCHYCDKVLSEEKGEHDHGCLTCHGEPWQAKIDKLEAEKKELVEALEYIRTCYVNTNVGDIVKQALTKIKSEVRDE